MNSNHNADLAFAKLSLNKSSLTGSLCHHIWYEPSALNNCASNSRQSQIRRAIREFLDLNGHLPSGRYLRKIVRCHPDTAKAALDAVTAELEQEHERAALLYLFSSYDNSIGGPFSKSTQAGLDGSTCALAFCPGDSFLITAVCSSDAEWAYAALACNSNVVVKDFLQGISVALPKDFDFHWLFAWEVQERGALHCHILLNLPSGHSITESLLTRMWMDNLEKLSIRYGIRFLASRSTEHMLRFEPYVLDTSGRFRNSYLGKQKSKTARRLALAGDKAVFPQKWGVVSRKLRRQTKELSIKMSIPTNSQREAFKIIERSVAASGFAWQEHCSHFGGQNKLLGFKRNFAPANYLVAKQFILDQIEHVKANSNTPALDAAIDFVVFELSPTGRCVIRHQFNRANFKRQEQLQAATTSIKRRRK
jgi:hypothetical protein